MNGTGLTNGQTYYYKVYAVNIAGNGTNSAEVNAVPKTTPNAPLSISTSAGSAVNQITLTWVAPNNGGSAITNYKIYRGTSPGGESTTAYASLGNVLTYTDPAATAAQGRYLLLHSRSNECCWSGTLVNRSE